MLAEVVLFLWLYGQFTVQSSACDDISTTDMYCDTPHSCSNLTIVDGIYLNDNSEVCDVTCSGLYSCQNSWISGVRTVSCDGESSCATSVINNIDVLNCFGKLACNGITMSNVNSINCDGDYSCYNMEITNVTNMTCSGDESCNYNDFSIMGANQDVDIYSDGSINQLSCDGFSSCCYCVFDGTANTANINTTNTTNTIVDNYGGSEWNGAINIIHITGNQAFSYNKFIHVNITLIYVDYIEFASYYSLYGCEFMNYTMINTIEILDSHWSGSYNTFDSTSTIIEQFRCDHPNNGACSYNTFNSDFNGLFYCKSSKKGYPCCYNTFNGHLNKFECRPSSSDGNSDCFLCSHLSFITIDSFECITSSDLNSKGPCRYINVTDFVETFKCKRGARCRELMVNGFKKIIGGDNDFRPSYDNGIIKSGNRGANVKIIGAIKDSSSVLIMCEENDTCFIYDSTDLNLKKNLQCYGHCYLFDNDKEPKFIQFPWSDNCGSWWYHTLVLGLIVNTIIRLFIMGYWFHLHKRLQSCFDVIQLMKIPFKKYINVDSNDDNNYDNDSADSLFDDDDFEYYFEDYCENSFEKKEIVSKFCHINLNSLIKEMEYKKVYNKNNDDHGARRKKRRGKISRVIIRRSATREERSVGNKLNQFQRNDHDLKDETPTVWIVDNDLEHDGIQPDHNIDRLKNKSFIKKYYEFDIGQENVNFIYDCVYNGCNYNVNNGGVDENKQILPAVIVDIIVRYLVGAVTMEQFETRPFDASIYIKHVLIDYYPKYHRLMRYLTLWDMFSFVWAIMIDIIIYVNFISWSLTAYNNLDDGYKVSDTITIVESNIWHIFQSFCAMYVSSQVLNNCFGLWFISCYIEFDSTNFEDRGDRGDGIDRGVGLFFAMIKIFCNIQVVSPRVCFKPLTLTKKLNGNPRVTDDTVSNSKTDNNYTGSNWNSYSQHKDDDRDYEDDDYKDEEKAATMELELQALSARDGHSSSDDDGYDGDGDDDDGSNYNQDLERKYLVLKPFIKFGKWINGLIYNKTIRTVVMIGRTIRFIFAILSVSPILGAGLFAAIIPIIVVIISVILFLAPCLDCTQKYMLSQMNKLKSVEKMELKKIFFRVGMFVIYIQCFYILNYMVWRMSVFNGAALYRGAPWMDIISGKYMDSGNNYCTNKNFLLFPNQVNFSTIVVWMSWWIPAFY